MTEAQIKEDVQKHTDEFLAMFKAGTMTLEQAHDVIANLGNTEVSNLDLMQISGLAMATALFQCGD